MEDKLDIVIWSGGYDSTLILDKLCASGAKNVWAYAIDWDMVDELKRQQENLARRNYIEFAKTKNIQISLHEITLSTNMGVPCEDGLPQAMMWFGI